MCTLELPQTGYFHGEKCPWSSPPSTLSCWRNGFTGKQHLFSLYLLLQFADMEYLSLWNGVCKRVCIKDAKWNKVVLNWVTASHDSCLSPSAIFLLLLLLRPFKSLGLFNLFYFSQLSCDCLPSWLFCIQGCIFGPSCSLYVAPPWICLMAFLWGTGTDTYFLLAASCSISALWQVAVPTQLQLGSRNISLSFAW